MKKTIYSLVFGLAASLGFYSCQEGSVGTSISQNGVTIVMDSTFTVTGSSLYTPKIQSRTTTQLLGLIKAPNYGVLRSDYVTQFMPSLTLDTLGVKEELIDSVKLFMRIPMGGYVGDSLAPMRVNVYALHKQLTSPIYSDFDPKEYYSEENLMGSAPYVASAIGLSDSLDNLRYREVSVKMPIEWGRKFFREFKNNPQTFSTPQEFAKFFPGVYVTTSYGNGRIMNIDNTTMSFFYRKVLPLDDKKDTTLFAKTDYLAATPEIISNNNINLSISNDITELINSGNSVIQAPAGYDVKLRFPVQEIIDRFRTSVGTHLGIINNVYMEIPAVELGKEFGITPPPYLLLLKETEKDKFFATNSITNDISSFYAKYDAQKKAYIFSNMRDYILDIIRNQEGVAKEEDKNLLLTPVSISTETSSTTGEIKITNISPYIQTPAVAKLDLENAKIKLVFNMQKVNF